MARDKGLWHATNVSNSRQSEYNVCILTARAPASTQQCVINLLPDDVPVPQNNNTFICPGLLLEGVVRNGHTRHWTKATEAQTLWKCKVVVFFVSCTYLFIYLFMCSAKRKGNERPVLGPSEWKKTFGALASSLNWFRVNSCFSDMEEAKNVLHR